MREGRQDNSQIELRSAQPMVVQAIRACSALSAYAPITLGIGNTRGRKATAENQTP